MKILLLRPPRTRRSLADLSLFQEPVGHMALGPALRARGHEVRLVDQRVTPDLERELAGFRPDAAVVGLVTLVRPCLDATLDRVTRLFPGIRVLLHPDAEYGADHVAVRPQDYVHPKADVLVLKQSLNSLVRIVPDVVDAWEQGRPVSDVAGLMLRSPDGEWVATEDCRDEAGDYGVPDRTLLGRARGRYVFGGLGDTAYVFTSLGCRHGCRYCTMSKWSGEIFQRSRADVLAELESLTERNVFLSDFEILQVPERALELAKAVKRAGIRKHFYVMTRADSVVPNLEVLRAWKDVGLGWVFLGLDGHSTKRLKELRKGADVDVNRPALEALKELGLRVAAGFVVRPDFSLEEFRELRRYVLELRPPAVGFTVETPLVGTALYDSERSRLTTRDWSLFDMEHAVLPTKLPLKRFYREMVKLHLLGLALGSRTVVGGGMTLSDKLRGGWTAARTLTSLWFGERHHRDRSPATAAALQAG